MRSDVLDSMRWWLLEQDHHFAEVAPADHLTTLQQTILGINNLLDAISKIMRLGLIHRTHYYIRIEFNLEVGGEVIQDLLAPSVEVIVDAPVGDAFQVDKGEHAALVKVHLLALH